MRPCQSVVLRGICTYLREVSFSSSNANWCVTNVYEKSQSVKLIAVS